MSQDTCRICMGTKLLSNIFRFQESMTISSHIMSIANVTITPNDGLPDKICNLCVNKLDDCINFIRLCESSDRKHRKILEKCSENEESPTSPTTTEVHVDLSQDKFLECKSITESNTSNVFMGANKMNNKDSNQQNTDLKTSKKKEKQQCSTCGKFMSCRFRLKTHLRTHTEERPYSCPHCSKSFSLAQNLKGEKPLQCSVCGESFAHSAGLATHKRKHTGQTPYRCVLCPRSFRTVGHLQYHV
ncbi:putative zinc finger protein 45-like protein, partial [Operophtera brumata]